MLINLDYIYKALDELTYEANSKSSTYYNQDGIKVPRVTEVLSRMIHSDGLMYWANNMGLKGYKYKDLMTTAANIGTYAHKAIEIYLRDNINTEDNIPFQGFLMWYNILTKEQGLSVEVVYVEHKLACRWFGGTLDCLMKINGKYYLLDFKTSNHVTFSYFLQLAAYRYMLYVTEGIIIDGIIVLQLCKDEPGFNEYMLVCSNPEHMTFINHCEVTFMSLVYAFYNLQETEVMYKEIF